MSTSLAWTVLAGIGAGLLLSASAHAETPGAVALDQLETTPPGDPFFGVPSPSASGHLALRALLAFSHTEDPLTVSDSTGERAIVGSQSYLDIGASLALWDRLLLSARLPIAVAQSGEGSAELNEPAPGAPDAPALGDLRLGARIRLFGDDGAPFQVGAGFYLHLPTGDSEAFVGEGAVRDSPQIVLGGRVGRVVWSAFGGAVLRSSENPSTLTYGAGAAALLWDDRLQVGPEVYASTPLQDGSIPISETARLAWDRTTSVELLVGARVRLIAGLALGAAAGPGLTDAIGTPTFRALGTLSWAPSAAHSDDDATSDSDEDGLLNADDACPYAFGPKNADPRRRGCPVEDRDEDGVEDAKDACPDAAGAASADPKRRGCPADSDGDGVADGDDACPAEKGEASADAARRGCPAVAALPADTDGDGLLDDADACPREKGPASNDAGARGCPLRVRVKGDEVVTLEPVGFRISRTETAPLDPRSVPVLEELRDVIAQHGEWAKIEVQGHTDNTGNAKYNEGLSAARAESVRKWLVDHGVAAERLVAKGYGGSRPIESNTTASGREKNRRVQLLVLEKK